MKLKIKVKRMPFSNAIPKIIDKGDWIDLASNDTVKLKAPSAGTLKRVTKNGETTGSREVTFDNALIRLGVAMELPKGFEALVVPRSSTYKHFGIISANSIGVIDNCYKGNTDEWKFPAIALRDTKINCGDRIAQFRIQLSQKANIWQKLRWLLYSKIELIEVNALNNINRSGFGSTGKS